MNCRQGMAPILEMAMVAKLFDDTNWYYYDVRCPKKKAGQVAPREGGRI